MPLETTVTVVVGSEVSASVLATASNTITHSTPDVSWFAGIISWFMNLL